MMKIHNIIKSAAAMALMIAPLSASAQLNTPAAIEKLKEQNVWFNSKNAAGAVYDDTRNFSNVIAGYDAENGDFKRPQQGESDKNVTVSSEGFLNLEKAFVWGKFNFKHEDVKDASYNASITDPFRGMPYYVIDNYSDSKWRNQFYDLQFRVSTPLIWNWLTLGIDGLYKASIAAKQRDPSVDTRFYTLQLIPGATFSFNSYSRLGVTVEYASVKEDSYMNNTYSYLNQPYWVMYGLGTATYGYGYNGPTVNYYGDKWGAGVQYQYNKGAWNILLEGNYTKKVENADNSFSNPRKDFAVNDQTLGVKATVIRNGEQFTHIVKAGWDYRHIDGIQFINQRDNSEAQQGWLDLSKNIRSTYITRGANFKYVIQRNRGEEYNWRVDASVAYVAYDDQYILPHSTKDSKNLYVDLEAKKNFNVGEKLNSRLLIALQGGLRNAMSGSYVYGGTHEDYPSVVGLEPADEAYLTSDAYHFGGSITYSQQLKADQKLNVFAKAAVDYHKSKADEFDKRSYISCSVGVNF